MSESVCVFDVETTGTNADSDQIIELCIQQGLDDTAQSHVWRFKPQVPISPAAQQVHGISMDDLKECPPFAAEAAAIKELLTSAKVFVGYNLAFDLDFVQAEFRRIGEQPIDIADKLLVDPYQLWRHFEPRNLAAAHQRFAGAEMTGAHAAAEDVAATGRVLQGMLKEFKLADSDWREVAELCPIHKSRKKWIGPSNHFLWQGQVGVFGFGKHRMRPIVEVAKENNGSYAQWIRSKDFPEHVKEIVTAALEQSNEEFNDWLSKQYG